MKVLILSCKTGGGHDAAGLAMKEALEAKGHEAILLDYLTLAGQNSISDSGRCVCKYGKNSASCFRSSL